MQDQLNLGRVVPPRPALTLCKVILFREKIDLPRDVVGLCEIHTRFYTFLVLYQIFMTIPRKSKVFPPLSFIYQFRILIYTSMQLEKY